MYILSSLLSLMMIHLVLLYDVLYIHLYMYSRFSMCFMYLSLWLWPLTLSAPKKITTADDQCPDVPHSSRSSSLVGGLSLHVHLLQGVPRLIDASIFSTKFGRNFHSSNRPLFYSLYAYNMCIYTYVYIYIHLASLSIYLSIYLSNLI